MPTKRSKKPAEIFISHSSKNRAFVERLVGAIEAHGLKVFYSKKSIKGAQQWHDEIQTALGRCSWFVVVLSPDSIKSEWVKREFLYALQERRYKGRLMPVLRQSCKMSKLSFTLQSIQYIDFRANFDAACAQLIARLKPARGR